MNATHLHLLLNHIPVLGSVFALGLLAFGIWRKSAVLQKAALGAFVIAALIAIPAYLTGEPAEEIVESLAGVSESIIENHEDVASFAFGGILALGVIALTGLVLFRGGESISSRFNILITVCAIIVCALMAWTANLGGQIRHTEIRQNSAQLNSNPEKDDD